MHVVVKLMRDEPNPGHSSTANTGGYIQDAKERLRRLARETGPEHPLVEDLDARMERLFGQQRRPEPGPDPGPAERAPESFRPQAMEAPMVGMHDFRATVIDRVVDRVVDRVLLDWERSGRSSGSLDEQIIERLAERLFARFKADH